MYLFVTYTRPFHDFIRLERDRVIILEAKYYILTRGKGEAVSTLKLYGERRARGWKL